MGGINLINKAEIFGYIDGFDGDVEEKALEIFQFVGTSFQRDARQNANFIDRTKNLRNSIGFSVAVKGRAIGENFGGLGGDESWSGDTNTVKNQLLRQIKGIGLLGMAGMHYGIYVENMKGKSVISQSIPETEKLLNRLFDEL